MFWVTYDASLATQEQVTVAWGLLIIGVIQLIFLRLVFILHWHDKLLWLLFHVGFGLCYCMLLPDLAEFLYWGGHTLPLVEL
jgi:hypothetical protein